MPDVVAGEPFDESLDSSTGNEPYKMLATGFSWFFRYFPRISFRLRLKEIVKTFIIFLIP